MSRPRLLDLFSGAGGCAVGYHRAGFDVTGVDNKFQTRYPFTFIQADALEYLEAHGKEYDVIHASPPCQGYSVCKRLPNVHEETFPLLVEPVRELLAATGKPYIIENVLGAPLLLPTVLCGTMFSLKCFRHRLFEHNFFLMRLKHVPHGKKRIGKDGFCCVAGHGDGGRKGWGKIRERVPADHRRKEAWQKSLGIDWMLKRELTQAIPPAYTEFIGHQLMEALR